MVRARRLRKSLRSGRTASAKEQAKAWLRSGRPQMPHELWSALSVLPDADEVYGRPEHTTRLDKFSRARQHDVFACLPRNGVMTSAVGRGQGLPGL
jgi:hypothetical protein